MSQNPVDLVLDTLKCNQSALARALNVTPAVISIWRKRGGFPVKRVKRVSEVSGIPTFMLCPDYFPVPALGGVAQLSAPAVVPPVSSIVTPVVAESHS